VSAVGAAVGVGRTALWEYVIRPQVGRRSLAFERMFD